MMIYKLIAVAFVFLTPIFSYIMVNFFRLGRFGIKFPDIAFPIFALEISLVSDKLLNHSFFPYFLIALSLLSIALVIGFLRKTKSFSYRRFFKFFWRSGFILTFIFYLIVLAFVFIV